MPQMVMEGAGTQTPPPRRTPLRRQRNFTLLWTGQTISMTGSAVTTVGLPQAAITMLGASALQVGLLTAATYGAFILVAPPAGVVVDRFRKRRIMIWCDSARLVIIGSVPVAAALHRLTSVCPPDLRGRMNAASRWITWGVLPIGGLLGGFAGSAIGIRPSIWIAYAGSWAAGFLVYFSPLRRVRDVSDI